MFYFFGLILSFDEIEPTDANIRFIKKGKKQ